MAAGRVPGQAGAAVAAGALAFLPWNAVRARVFLGDAGSYGLGLALALLAAQAVVRHVPLEAALAPLALYLADTGWTLQRRVRAGERIFEAHRTHTYQRLCDVGWSHQRVTLATTAVTVAVCLLGAASLTGHPALRWRRRPRPGYWPPTCAPPPAGPGQRGPAPEVA